MMVVMLQSNTARKAFLKPALVAAPMVLPAATSSRMRAKMSTLASTAIPSVRIMPAMPGKVMVTPMALSIPMNKTP